MGMPVPKDAQTKQPRLYNLEDDIGETIDVAAAHPEIIARLSTLAKKMNAEIGGRDPAARRPAGKVTNPGFLFPAEAQAQRN
jgi:hypothetical protein